MTLVQHTTRLRVNNVAKSIVDGNLVAFFLLASDTLHIAQRQLADVVILVQFQ